MKIKGMIAILLCAVAMTACHKGDYPTGDALREGVTRVADYLYESTYYEYDKTAAMSYMMDSMLLPGACASVRSGNYFGRNFDWYYDTSVEFVVHVPAEGERYASVGIAGGIPTLTAAVVESGKENGLYDCLPYITLDGINENGVVVSVNMLPLDFPKTNNTQPGMDSLPQLMAPRYVLDHATTAADAVELLKGVNIVAPKMDIEVHLMIADENETYVVEWIDGKLQSVCDSMYVMTNFYQLCPMTPHSMGVERYNLAKEYQPTANTLADMTKLMHTLRFSRAYDRTMKPFWYSDYNGDWTAYDLGNLTIDSEESEYATIVKNSIKNYRRHVRDIKYDVWQTTHTAIYDIEQRTMVLFVQENYNNSYTFTVVP